MKLYIKHIPVVLGLLLVSSCANDEPEISQPEADTEINFSATLQQSEVLLTRAQLENPEDGKPVAFPFIPEVHITKVANADADDQKVGVFGILTGNKGVLKHQGGDKLEWDQTLTSEKFYGWTTPTGVEFYADRSKYEGTVDFIQGNDFTAAQAKDQLNGSSTIPLNIFVAAVSEECNYNVPTVPLPFTHRVAKISIRLFLDDAAVKPDFDGSGVVTAFNNLINDASISFPNIPSKWNLGLDQNVVSVVNPKASLPALTLDLKKLKWTEYNTSSGAFCFSILLPPMRKDLGTDFTTRGNYVITINGTNYYGSLKDVVFLNTENTRDELDRGQHMFINMYLSPRSDIGTDGRIIEWEEGEGGTLYTHSQRGIYTPDNLAELLAPKGNGEDGSTINADPMNSPFFYEDTDSSSPDNGKTVVKFHENIDLRGVPVDELKKYFPIHLPPNTVIDGNNFVLMLPDGFGGPLFALQSSSDTGIIVRDLYIKTDKTDPQDLADLVGLSSSLRDNCNKWEDAVNKPTAITGEPTP